MFNQITLKQAFKIIAEHWLVLLIPLFLSSAVLLPLVFSAPVVYESESTLTIPEDSSAFPYLSFGSYLLSDDLMSSCVNHSNDYPQFENQGQRIDKDFLLRNLDFTLKEGETIVYFTFKASTPDLSKESLILYIDTLTDYSKTDSLFSNNIKVLLPPTDAKPIKRTSIVGVASLLLVFSILFFSTAFVVPTMEKRKFFLHLSV